MALNINPEMLQAPIPGMSLTKAPREYTWENPPEYTRIEDVIEHYTGRILDPEVEDSLLLALDEGAAIDMLTDFLITSGSMNGRHALDLGFLAAPVIIELIKFTADSADVKFIESYKKLDADKKLPYRELRKVIKEVFNTTPDIDTESPEINKVVPKGLMARAPETKPLLDELPTDISKENL